MSLKRYVWILAVGGGLLALALGAASRVSAADKAANGPVPLTDQKFATKTRGQVVYTAAINADGTIAKCYGCVASKTEHISTGEYQVAFGAPMTAKTGVSRWVMPDTLTTGEEFTWCDTADRAGVTTAIWVNCQNASGAVDTSFFIFVAK